MRKPLIIIIIALYLIILNSVSLPVLFKMAEPYNPQGDSINFLLVIAFIGLKFIVVANIIAAIGLLFIKEWARKSLIAIILSKFIMGIASYSFFGFQSMYTMGDLIYLLIFFYLISPIAKSSIRKYNLSTK